MFTITNRVSAVVTFTAESVTHVTNGDVRKRTVIRKIFGIHEKTADLSYNRRYIVGTLTN